MYKLIRPLLFLIQPERVHGIVVSLVKITFRIPGLKFLVKKACSVNNPNLAREVFGLKFANPVGLAAGFDKNAEMYNHFDAFGFSFVEIGTVTPKAQPGNPKPRSFRLPKDKALINRMGFNNLGLENAKANLLKNKGRVIIGGNIGKNTATPNEDAVADYLDCFKGLYNVADYFVVNVSCPNVMNLKALQDSSSLRAILASLTEYRKGQSKYKPILLKVSPDLSEPQLDDNINIAVEMGLDGFVAANTTTSRQGLVTDKHRVEAIGNGGLSGAPVRDKSTEVIRRIHSKTNGKMPIIGVGGIMSPRDAQEKLEAGATLIQLYTGFIYEGPCLAKRICREILRTK